MKTLFICVFLFVSVLFSQPKTLIFFKDKGEVSAQSFSKQSYAYQQAFTSVSAKSIARRLKDNTRPAVDYTDVPINELYVKQLETMGYKIIHRLKWFNAVSVIAPNNNGNNILQLPFIESIAPVRTLTFRTTSPVPFTSVIAGKSVTPAPNSYGPSLQQMALSDIPQLHKLGIAARGTMIGYLDSGFDWKNHEALKTRTVLAERDFIFNDNNTANQTGDHPGQHDHGTYCFSIAAGYKDSVLIGAAYDATFLLAKTEDIRSETHIEEDNYAAALQWMDSIGVDITSSSLGYNIFDTGGSYKYADMNGATTIVTKACELAFGKGILTVSAAGNEGAGAWKYIVAPGDGVFTLSVGAVSYEDTVAGFSSQGPSSDGRVKPDVVAMGFETYGARASTTNLYLYNSGTSAATPIVSAVAGMILGVYPHLNNQQLRSMIQFSGNSYFKPNNFRGYGLVSALRALEIPNLQPSGTSFVLHKFVYSENNSVSSVTAFIKRGSTTDSITLTSLGQGRFSAPLPSYQSGTVLSLSFRSTSITGVTSLYPADGTQYSVSYGSVVLQRSKQNSGGTVSSYTLELPSPNPFSSSTSIEVLAPKSGVITLSVYNSAGEQVAMVYNGFMESGNRKFTWNGRNNMGNRVADGVYIFSLQTDEGTTARKTMLLKK